MATSPPTAVRPLRIGFETGLPLARWGPLFHVFLLEHPGVRLDWHATGHPARGRSLLDGADVGLFLAPAHEPGLSGLTLDSSPMVVLLAAGHRLAHHDQLCVDDILAEPFPGGADLDPEWTAFWTLRAQRARPPRFSDDAIRSAEDGLQVVAAGRAIATAAAWAADGLAHPGVVALPLRDGPAVETRLVWRSGDENPAVGALVELATAWVRRGPTP